MYDIKKYKKCQRILEDARAIFKILGLRKSEIEFRLPNINVLFKIPEDITNPYKTLGISEEPKCPNCEEHSGPLEFKTDIGEGDVYVCEDCYNDLEGEEDDDCPCCGEPDSECEAEGGYTDQCC